MNPQALFDLLETKYRQYNQLNFIESDPIVIPHRFSNQQDIEISGLFAAVLAWGQRVTIIKKTSELMHRMDEAPHQFITQHSEADLKRLERFVHRTFNDTDLLHFIRFLHHHYKQFDSLEDAFISNDLISALTVENGLNTFYDSFFALPDSPPRTRKHIPSPQRKSACKRLNMYLRWMVRKDQSGVDFGIWNRIKPSQLVCPCDVHVERVARHLGLIQRKQMDWLTAVELTTALKTMDAHDPVKYDFALFGLGVFEKWGS